MTETDIQRYAREVAAVDLTTFDLSHPTTAEYRLAHEVVRLREENDRLREGKEIVTSMLFDQVPLLNRMQDTLDRLRAPSDDVIDAASHAFTTAMTGDGDWYAGDQWGSIAKAIEAAVAAAEQEVSA